MTLLSYPAAHFTVVLVWMFKTHANFNHVLLLPGLLKAINCGERSSVNRIVKDTVMFQASDFMSLVEKLQIDLHEPPVSQVIEYFTV